MNLSGPISGTGGITKTGAGTLIFSGSSGNTYSGTTTVDDGIVELNKSAGVSISGPLVIGDGSGGEASDIVRYLSSADLDSVPVTVNSSGLLDLNNFNDAIGALTLNGGEVTTGNGLLRLGGNLTANGTFILGNLSLGSATRTIEITGGLDVDAVISGGAGVGFIKTGSGELRLFGTNTYSGLTTVSNGSIFAANAAAFGSSAAGTVLSGGNIEVETVTVANESLTNNSSSSALIGFGGFTSGWSSNIVLNADLNVSVFTNGTLNLSGAITGTGGVTKASPAHFATRAALPTPTPASPP